MLVLIVMGFLAGVATVLSPCILPILPIMLSGAIGGRAKPYGILVGFVLSFATFTVFATYIVQSLGIDIDVLRYFAAGILVVLGALLLFPKLQYKLNSLIKMPQTNNESRGGFWGGFLTGLTLGLVWAPCAGPILAAVITLAATSSAGWSAFLIVIAYALGTGIVMLVIILASRQAIEKIKGLYKYLEAIHRAFGILIILAGLAIAGGYDRKAQGYIVDNIPESWNQFLQSFEESDAVQNAIEGLEGDMDIKPVPKTTDTKELIDSFMNTGKFRQFKTNIAKTSVDLDDLLSGGPAKDGIPALTNPEFVGIDDVDIDDEVLGVLVNIDEQKRFYPYNILVWHEIVNDSIGGSHFAVTFCPLCGSAIVFDRNVDNRILEFGVSGFLYESNLVMYDKQSESLWSQAGLKSIVGHYLDTELAVLNMKLISFLELRQKYPDADILSANTGYNRDYDFYPYGDYDEDDNLFFPVSINDNRFPAKAIMYVTPHNEKSIAIPYDDLEKGKTVYIDIEGDQLSARRDNGSIIVSLDGEKLPGYYEMWFSWATQHQKDGIVWQVK